MQSSLRLRSIASARTVDYLNCFVTGVKHYYLQNPKFNLIFRGLVMLLIKDDTFLILGVL